ncbi:MAG: hypothetical protein MRERV_8c044 [Mycoplasmataceae bacterium RV_VA103A]|nr:MAG: hypothetical protein MRERV_8c044 [Mycoplasmataceae bacterium RV_VA103A]
MNKTKLQQEILEKVKPGTKPSDLKKKRGNAIQFTHSIPTPPPSPVLKPTKTNNLKELQQQVQFHAREAQNYLSSLQKLTAENDNLKEEIKKIKPTKTQTELEKALQEANEKIRKLEQKNDPEHILEKHNPYKEKVKELETKIHEQYKTIEDLKKQVKNKENDQEQKLFTCYNCYQSQFTSLLVLEIPDKGPLCKSCWQLFRQQTKNKSSKFTCHNCQETKTEKEYQIKLDASDKLYSICPTCLPKVKEYNEKEADSQRELDIWE